jgi:hypothetical protein
MECVHKFLASGNNLKQRDLREFGRAEVKMTAEVKTADIKQSGISFTMNYRLRLTNDLICTTSHRQKNQFKIPQVCRLNNFSR